MENEKGKSKLNYTKLAIGAGITFGVVLLACTVHGAFIQPMVAKKLAGGSDKKA